MTRSPDLPSLFSKGILMALTAGLLAGCNQNTPVVAAPSPPASTNLNTQTFTQSRMPVGAGTIQTSWGDVAVGARGNTVWDIDAAGKPAGISCTTGSGVRFTLSSDKNTMTRVWDCDGTTGSAVLHRIVAPGGGTSYVGYHQYARANGEQGIGPYLMTPSMFLGTIEGRWKLQWSEAPLGGLTSQPIVITPDGRQQGFSESTIQYRLIDNETQLNRLGTANGGGNAASLNQITGTNTYDGWYNFFNSSDVPTNFGPYQLTRPSNSGLSGTWAGRWADAPVTATQKQSLRLDAAGLNAGGACPQVAYTLSADKTTLFRSGVCGTAYTAAELHRIPGTNTYSGYHSYFDVGNNAWNTTTGVTGIGPFQIKLTDAQAMAAVRPPLTQLVLEGKSLLTSSSDSGTLSVIGLDAGGNRYPVQANEVDWSVATSGKITLTPNSSGEATAGVVAQNFAPAVVNVVARLKSNPALGVQGTVTLAALQSGVKTLNDAQTIYPPVTDLPEGKDYATFALPGVQLRSGDLYFADFSADEVAGRYDYDAATNLVRMPVVTK